MSPFKDDEIEESIREETHGELDRGELYYSGNMYDRGPIFSVLRRAGKSNKIEMIRSGVEEEGKLSKIGSDQIMEYLFSKEIVIELKKIAHNARKKRGRIPAQCMCDACMEDTIYKLKSHDLRSD